MIEIPSNVMAEVMRQQAAMDWPKKVPAFACLPSAAGVDLYYRHQDVTVAVAEQLVEYHVRTARSILGRGLTEILPSGHVEDAARHILMARLYRCTYITLIGQEDSREGDMPFAHNRWCEVAENEKG